MGDEMTNRRLFVILGLILLVLIGLVVREFQVHGGFGGLIIGVYVVPALFVLSCMVGLLLGMRKPEKEGDPKDAS